MSEDIKTLQVKVIKPNSVINIEVGTGFYERVQELFLKHINDNPEHNFLEAIENLKTKNFSNVYEYHLETLLSLLYEIEAKAQAQGLIAEKPFEFKG